MKRALDEATALSSKRKRPCDEEGEEDTLNDVDPFCPSSQRKATDVCNQGVDESGYIQGVVHMKWPVVGEKIRFLLEVKENGHSFRFEVALVDTCADYFRSSGFNFAIRDSLQIGLRGATVEKLSNARENTIPMVLRFNTGVVLRFLSSSVQGRGGMLIDTWGANACDQSSRLPKGKVSNGDGPLGDDWFATPAIQPTSADPQNSMLSQEVPPVSTTPASSIPQPPNGSKAPMPPLTPLGPVIDRTSRPPSRATKGRQSPAISESSATAPARVPVRLYRDVPNGGSRPTREALKKLSPQPPTQPTTASETLPSAVSTSEISAKPSKKAEKKAKRDAKRAQKLQDQLSEITRERPNESRSNDTAATAQPNIDPAVLLSPEVPLLATQSPGPPNDDTEISVPPRAPGSPSPTSGRKSRIISPPSATTPVRPEVPVRPNTNHSPVPAAKAVSSNDDDPALNLEAGCQIPGVTSYAPFDALQPTHTYNVIGVIVNESPFSKTRNGEYSRKILLVDPSNLQADNLDRGFSLLVFTKRPQDNIPPTKIGDILMFRGATVVDWNGSLNGSAPSYRPWVWALFSPKTGKTMHGQHADSSSSQPPHQVPVSTFEPCEAELQYCIRLGDWWKAVQRRYEREQKANGGVIVRVGEGDVANYSGRGGRIHRLIKDASPYAPPDGYFDCTVEVLHGFKNDNGVFSLHVTDYTKNEGITPVQATWCPQIISDLALKVEMWYGAAEMGPAMSPGEYYFIGNVRMKVSGGGYLEATVSDRKIRKLDADELEDEPELAELLGRKSAWEKSIEGVEPGEEFPHWLIEEVVPEKYFRCTVQVLSISHKDDRAYIYVTDYTSRQDRDLVPVHFESGINVPENSIVKVLMMDGQATIAKSLEPNDFVSLRNLRLKSSSRISGPSSNLSGKLGGDQRLVFKLQPQGTGSEELLALIRRKEEWEARIKRDKKPKLDKGRKSAGKGEIPNRASVKPSTSNNNGQRTINRVLACTLCPARFRITARAIDFYPLKIEDFVVLRCTNCEEDLPAERRMCTKCDDSLDETFVRPFWRFFLRVEDREGTPLEILINSADCTLLDGLEPSDLHEDEETLGQLRERLTPVLGNLEEIHDAIVNKTELPEPDTPMLDLVIASCPMDDAGMRSYVLLQHRILS